MNLLKELPSSIKYLLFICLLFKLILECKKNYIFNMLFM